MGLFKDSLKKWFYTNNSSAASSDARVPLLNADGTPKGSDTMANLASVLGVAGVMKFVSGKLTDCNSPGVYIIQYSTTSDIQDLPCTGHAFMLVLSSSTNASALKTQFFVSMTQRAFIRVKTGIGWQSWKEITLTTVVQ